MIGEVLAKCFRVERVKLIRLALYFCLKFLSMNITKEKVKGFISSIPTNKKKHFSAGFVICAIVSLFCGYLFGLAAAAIAAAGKEVRDYITKKGMPEFADFVYTIVGAVAFILCSVVVTLLAQTFFMWIFF